MRNQKVAQAIRSQGWAAECAEEPLDHCKRNKQVLDTGISQAHARSRLHQPIQEVVGHKSEVKGYGLAVKRGENLF